MVINIVLGVLFLVISIAVSRNFWKEQTAENECNKEKLEKAKNFFLADPSYSVKVNGDDRLIEEKELSDDLLKLVHELNQYISRNKGTTDFSIIQNKTERYASTLYENAVSNLGAPTSLGLYGTFIGVMMGLGGFVINLLLSLFMDMGGNDEWGIILLIAGVFVSMLTSARGLYLTIGANKQATDYKRDMDKRKNLFFDFIQNELMPVLGMSVVAALTQLRETLLHFTDSFDVVTDKFERTFDGCTEKFGKAFEKNIVAVADAANKLGGSIDVVNQNVKNQQALLKELRSGEMLTALDLFVKAGLQFHEAVDVFKELDVVRKDLSKTISTLIATQKDYNHSLVVPKMIAERLNVILERITTFEDSINSLGASIAQTQMLGNSEMNLIRAHLDNIKQKDAIALEYQQVANDELKTLFDSETNVIKALHDRYTSAIEEHNDSFAKFMEEVTAAILEKRNEFVQTLENAFDMADLHTQFAQLNRLPEIYQSLETLKSLVDDLKTASNESTTVKVNKLGAIQESLAQIPSAMQLQHRELKASADEANNLVRADLQKLFEEIHLTSERARSAVVSLDALHALDRDHQTEWNEEKAKMQEQLQKLAELSGKMSAELKSMNEDSKQTLRIGKDELQRLESSIRKQQEQLAALQALLNKSKDGMNVEEVKKLKRELQELTEKVRTANALLDTTNQKRNNHSKQK